MHWTYSCPHCGAVLNPDETIMLVAKRAGKKILMGFHPAPGNYRAYVPPEESVNPGEVWEFSCPLCHASLVSYVDRNLCAIDLHEDDKKSRVYFSRVAGEQATFVMSEDGDVQTYGRHADSHSLELLEFI